MISSATLRKVAPALVASAVVHALALSALAWTMLPELRERLLEVRQTPFAGEQVAIALSFARPEVNVPPLPERPPVESPVLITPHEAQLDQRIYVDKQAAEVAAATITSTVEVAELMVPDAPAAERDTKDEGMPPAATSAASAVRKQPREVTPTTASVSVPPQTLGTHDRRPARMHNNRPPRYPDIARQNRWEGTVLLKLSIDAAGAVTAVDVATSSGYPILDAEAVTAVRQWRGEPATRDGAPIASEEYLPVRFRLR